MILAHIMGIPIEETFGQIAPVAAVTIAGLVVIARSSAVRWRNRLRRR